MNIFLILFFVQLIFNAESNRTFINEKHKHPKHIRYFQPEQIHIAFGDNVQEIVVTWSTFSETPNSIVEYGEGNFDLKAYGSAQLFVDGGPEKRGQYIHRVKLSNLKPLTHYVYHCGSNKAWSEKFWFKTVDSGTEWKPRLALFGDMGNKNARALPHLQSETQNSLYDAVIHIGDFAYDMRDDNGRVGDEFMRQIQPIAAYVPYMVSPGNHEEAYNFSHYRERFSMPGPYDNLFYSFNLGPIHFISFSTESYYYIHYGVIQLLNQYIWMDEDLKEANKPENRKKHPWIIAYGHRPMYCSGGHPHEECRGKPSRLREGTPSTFGLGLEKLFYETGVDIFFAGHEHSYERSWPLYNFEVKKGSGLTPYTNPKAPVHIITGSAGCFENLVNFTTEIPPWAAYRSKTYGYTVLEVHNKTHLHLQQISVDEGRDIIDDIWIINKKHGSFNLT